MEHVMRKTLNVVYSEDSQAHNSFKEDIKRVKQGKKNNQGQKDDDDDDDDDDVEVKQQTPGNSNNHSLTGKPTQVASSYEEVYIIDEESNEDNGIGDFDSMVRDYSIKMSPSNNYNLSMDYALPLPTLKKWLDKSMKRKERRRKIAEKNQQDVPRKSKLLESADGIADKNEAWSCITASRSDTESQIEAQQPIGIEMRKKQFLPICIACEDYQKLHQAIHTEKKQNIFEGSHIFLLEKKITENRLKIFRTKILELGGCLCTKMCQYTTVIVTELPFEQLSSCLVPYDSEFWQIPVVSTRWLSECIALTCFVDTSIYSILASCDKNKFSVTLANLSEHSRKQEMLHQVKSQLMQQVTQADFSKSSNIPVTSAYGRERLQALERHAGKYNHSTISSSSITSSLRSDYQSEHAALALAPAEREAVTSSTALNQAFRSVKEKISPRKSANGRNLADTLPSSPLSPRNTEQEKTTCYPMRGEELENVMSSWPIELCTAALAESDEELNSQENEAESDEENTEDEDYNLKTSNHSSNSHRGRVKLESFACSIPSTSTTSNFNKEITDILEKLEFGSSIVCNASDKFRHMSYTRAISVLKKYPKKIESREEAFQIPGIGSRIADKIAEILKTGQLKTADANDPKLKILNQFSAIYGCGMQTALKFYYSYGFKSLDDIRKHPEYLNAQQLIGLKYYDDFLKRISREEVQCIGEIISQVLKSISSNCLMEICGSYRRGKAECGDIDILISHKDGKSHTLLYSEAIPRLENCGLLVEHLSFSAESTQHKYMGVCCLPSSSTKTHRRIDMIFVPYSEWACALLYFTGSGYFNRSMRLLARKYGMSLSQHSLRAGVKRLKQEKLNDGWLIPTETEKDVFTALGLSYLPPEARNA